MTQRTQIPAVAAATPAGLVVPRMMRPCRTGIRLPGPPHPAKAWPRPGQGLRMTGAGPPRPRPEPARRQVRKRGNSALQRCGVQSTARPHSGAGQAHTGRCRGAAGSPSRHAPVPVRQRPGWNQRTPQSCCASGEPTGTPGARGVSARNAGPAAHAAMGHAGSLFARRRGQRPKPGACGPMPSGPAPAGAWLARPKRPLQRPAPCHLPGAAAPHPIIPGPDEVAASSQQTIEVRWRDARQGDVAPTPSRRTPMASTPSKSRI